MKMMRLKAAVLAFAGIAIVLTAQNKARAGALMTVHDTTTVVVKLTIGNPPTTTVSGTVQGHVSSSLSIVPATTYRYITASTRFINVSGNAGNTVTLTCPFTLSTTFSNPKVRYVFDLGASNDLFTSYGEPTRYIEYRSYVAGTTPSGRFGPLANFAHHANAFPIAGGSTPMSVCVDLKISIPAYATPGSYYTTVAGLFYDGAGGTGKPTPTPSPAPTPTVAPTPAPTPTPLPSYPAAVLADKPVIYYHMDEAPSSSGFTLHDSSGNGNDGLANPSGCGTAFQPVGSGVPTYNDAALAYGNGTCEIPTLSYHGFSSTAYSVEAWFESSVTTHSIMIYRGSYGACLSSLLVSVGDPQLQNIGVQSSNKLAVAIGEYQFSGSFANTPTVGVLSSANVLDGRWHHIVATWSAPAGATIDSSQLKIYVDGVDTTTTPFSSGTETAVSPLNLNYFDASCINFGGGTPGTAQIDMGGTGGGFAMDEYAVYLSSLSSTQILDHYHAAGY